MRLIDADALEKVIEEKFQTHYGNTVYQFIHDFFRCCIRQLRKAPTIPPDSLRPRGEWKINDLGYLVCPHCAWVRYGIPLVEHFNFCPNCGADMRGE